MVCTLNIYVISGHIFSGVCPEYICHVVGQIFASTIISCPSTGASNHCWTYHETFTLPSTTAHLIDPGVCVRWEWPLTYWMQTISYPHLDVNCDIEQRLMNVDISYNVMLTLILTCRSSPFWCYHFVFVVGLASMTNMTIWGFVIQLVTVLWLIRIGDIKSGIKFQVGLYQIPLNVSDFV